jgi:hypothetical protein
MKSVTVARCHNFENMAFGGCNVVFIKRMCLASFIGLAYQGKDIIVFRFIVKHRS